MSNKETQDTDSSGEAVGGDDQEQIIIEGRDKGKGAKLAAAGSDVGAKSWPVVQVPQSEEALLARSVDQGDGTVSLDIIPNPADPEVMTIMATLSDRLDFAGLHDNITKLARHLHIGTNAAADDAELLIPVQNALFDVIKLCDAVSLMIQTYRSSCDNIIEKLQLAFLYLVDGLPSCAKSNVERVSKDVRLMFDSGHKCLKQVKSLKSQVDVSSKLWKECDKRNEEFSDMSWNPMFFKALCHLSDGFWENRLRDQLDVSSDPDQEEHPWDTRPELETTEGNVLTDEGSESTKMSWQQIWAGRKNRSPKDNFLLFTDKVADKIKKNASNMSKDQSNKVETSRQPVGKRSPSPPPDDAILNQVKRHSESIYKVHLVQLSLGTSCEALDNMERMVESANGLVDSWFKECKEMIEPWLASGFNESGRLTADDQQRYWRSMWFHEQARSYYSRWRALGSYCENHRHEMRKIRQQVDLYYTENPYPRQAVINAWKLAEGDENDDVIHQLAQKNKDLSAKRGQ